MSDTAITGSTLLSLRPIASLLSAVSLPAPTLRRPGPCAQAGGYPHRGDVPRSPLLPRGGGARRRRAGGACREVLALMAEGRSNAGIAERLVLTVGTVE